ncbi:hypothetical protein CRE_12365 [Caenorhabditis remanei]|uniref:3'-5' exonuclease domain-containing protein n=1 Tax=Caenorhabditis remanei TaxID=31234 RepID=E3NMD8_CAERE|nr:hypothetical protein CRE_12365 [Caenorhabditis remanei]
MLNQSNRNSFTRGVLNTHFNAKKTKKTFSSAAIRDIIYYGGKHGFSKPDGKKIFAIVSNNCANQVGFKGEDFLEKLWEVLVANSRTAYFALKSREFENQFHYTELDHIKYRIIGDISEMKTIMRNQLTRGSFWPLYIDTEGAYPGLSNEANLALIIIFDVSSKIIYFFRTFHFDHAQLKSIRIAMKELEHDRDLVTFGPETSLQLGEEERKELKMEKLSTLDIQQKTGMSLKKMVDDWAGVKIVKTETMSCWTVPDLRHDQLHYAAMDAIALHYINIRSDVDWSFNPPKILNPDSTSRTPTFFRPVTH